MRCPLCLSDNLIVVNDSGGDTHCCENCGASFQVVQESQDLPLDKQELNDTLDKINSGDKNPFTLELILSYLQRDLIYYNEDYDHYSLILGKGNAISGD
jgi:hypothetical protein